MDNRRDLPGPWLEDLPAGLLTCFVGEEETGIRAISHHGIVLRMEKGTAPPEALGLCVFRSNACERFNLKLTDPVREEKSYWDEITASFDDRAASESILALLKDQNSFVLQRLNGTLAGERLGRTEDGRFFSDLEEAKRALLPHCKITALPEGMTAALSLDTPEKYARFLSTPFPRLWRELTAENGLNIDPVPERIDLGSGWCFDLLPEDWSPLLDRAEEQGLDITVVLPPAEESDLPRVRALLQVLRERKTPCELTVNDFGTAALAAEVPNLQPVYGLLLNKRLKDPRTRLLPEIPNNNSLNRADFREYLGKTFRFTRFEYDGPGEPPKGAACSIHLPWYQTNTGTLCPLRAARETGDRGNQRRGESCPRYCEQTAFSYAAELGLTGRYNSLFAADRESLLHPEKLKSRGFDRVVWELL